MTLSEEEEEDEKENGDGEAVVGHQQSKTGRNCDGGRDCTKTSDG